MKFSSSLVLGALLLSPLTVRAQSAIGSIISYQGRLSDAAGKPIANGTTSLTFKIYEAGVELTPQTQTLSVATVNGVFNAFLNVGTLSFDPTKAYELGITFGGTESRHPIAAVPVALNAKNAGSVSGVVPIANGGTGSTTQNFVDLTTAQTVAGAKSFNSAVTAPGFNIGADRILGANANSVFVGRGAGAAGENAFFNVFVGTRAGVSSTEQSNVFVGDGAGQNNTTGSSNTALGDLAGQNWTTGNFNLAIANRGVAGDTKTTRIGTEGNQSRAFIAGIRGTLVTGSPVVVSSEGQLGTGIIPASSLSGVVPVANGGTGSSTQNFVDLSSAQTVGGAKTFSSAVNTNTGYDLGGARILGSVGSDSLAVGVGAGSNNTGGSNIFFGRLAGSANTTGRDNTFLGAFSAQSSTGSRNTALGKDAFNNNSAGNDNIALGYRAGVFLNNGSGNIAIGNEGVAGDNTTRIGSGQTRAFIAGIRNVAVPGGSTVFIDGNGQLGTAISSSGRFKQDIASIGAGSDWLLKLRPVSYRYTAEFLKAAAPSEVQYGLIAEEVARVAPQMVHLDAQGRPDGVDYQNLPVMLLNQLQQQQKLIEALQGRLKQLEEKR